MTDLLHKEITDVIWRAALKVHRALGPGLLESAYEMCLFDELQRNGLEVARQVEMPVHFDGRIIDCGYRVDLLVARKVIVELNVVDALASIHSAQLLTYMRLAGIQVGLLMNFNCELLRDGVVRLALSNPKQNSPSATSASSAVESTDHGTSTATTSR